MTQPSAPLFSSIDDTDCECLQGGNGMSGGTYSLTYWFSKAPGQISFNSSLTTPGFTINKSFSFSITKTMTWTVC